MNLWEQYNPERPLGTVLGEITELPLWQCGDKGLFEALKRHLTRRELRCFAMDEGGLPGEAIETLHKARKKLRQPKLQQEFRALLFVPEHEEEHE